MDPLQRAQIILLCDLCKTSHLQSHCERCRINLCKVCVGEHLSDSSIRHNVVPYKYRKYPNYSNCPDHVDELCKRYCEKCDIPVCSICVSSRKHEDHNISDILVKLDFKLQRLQQDLEELGTKIYPKYEEMASEVHKEKAEVEINYWRMSAAFEQQGETLHREITTIVNQRKYVIQEMKNKHISTLNKNTDEITQRFTELKQIISSLKSILEANDVSKISTYKSRNCEFRTLPPKIQIKLPSFSPQKINNDHLNEMFGSLSSLPFNLEHDYTVNSPEAASSSIKPQLDEPRLNATIDTCSNGLLYSVSCLNEEEFWICGNSKFMKLLNLQGKLLATIQTKSGNAPMDIATTRCGNCVYTDHTKKNVNLMKNKKIQTIITLQGWRPLNVCSTSSDDLLVTMISDDRKQTKVVRYSGTTEKQTIQYDDQGRPLYSSGRYNNTKYISENNNLDICVADNIAHAVVVVNQSGKFRFRYTGYPSNSKESLDPYGITTDNHSHILIADFENHSIHIIDQDGQFLRYIKNCYLEHPYGLCVDVSGNLFVSEYSTAKVKKIQYL